MAKKIKVDVEKVLTERAQYISTNKWQSQHLGENLQQYVNIDNLADALTVLVTETLPFGSKVTREELNAFLKNKLK